MNFFNRNKANVEIDDDKRVYAFIGLGTMAKFMSEEKLTSFVKMVT